MTQTVSSASKASGRRHHKVTTPLDRFILSLSLRIGGDKAKEYERFIKFAFVGVLGFVIDAGTVLVLQNTILPPVNALGEALATNVTLTQSIAFVLAVCSNFVWNRLWTYPDSRSHSAQRQLTQFVIVSVIGWVIRTIWIAVSYEPFGRISTSILSQLGPDYAPALIDQHKIGAMIALFFGVIAVMFWNFLANRYWTYNDVD
ncbi:MAG: GtrA family protein [Chloroflexi bacterium]|nr:GtrA family protein [Chloroflexota bacterium]